MGEVLKRFQNPNHTYAEEALIKLPYRRLRQKQLLPRNQVEPCTSIVFDLRSYVYQNGKYVVRAEDLPREK